MPPGIVFADRSGFRHGRPWAKASALSVTPPAGLYLRGRVSHILSHEMAPPDQSGGTQPVTGPEMLIDYGIERYFIPESRQDQVQDLTLPHRGRTPEIGVEVAITRQGKGFLRRVLVDGKPLPY